MVEEIKPKRQNYNKNQSSNFTDKDTDTQEALQEICSNDSAE